MKILRKKKIIFKKLKSEFIVFLPYNTRTVFGTSDNFIAIITDI